MPRPAPPDELARLRADVAALRARADRPRRPRRLLPLALAALLVALVPLATLAANPFTDLTGGPHDGNIDAIYTAGITKGCDPTRYCPTDTVTRQEMASFLARTAGLGGNLPLANALTAQSAVTARTATSATNAATAQDALALGGQPASFYQPAGQPIANAQNAANATHATSADTATTATNATNAGNAGTVGGLAPGELTRAAAGRGFNVILTGSYQPVATATITAPRAGYVVATASLQAHTGAATGCPCVVSVQLYDATAGTQGASLVTAGTIPYSAGGEVYAAVPNTRVFPSGPGRRDIQVRAAISLGTATLGADAAITLVFTPYADAPSGGFASAGGRPLP